MVWSRTMSPTTAEASVTRTLNSAVSPSCNWASGWMWTPSMEAVSIVSA